MGKTWLLLLCCCITSVFAQNTELTPGVILKGEAHRDQVLYYEVGLKGETAPLIVTVTPLGSGDPDLFVSLTEQHPAWNTTTHKSQKAGQDSVTITPDLFAGHNMAYITVRPWFSGNQTLISFSIVASFGEVALLNGIPSNGETSSTRPARFTFTVPDNFSGEVLIAATPIQGNVLVYVSGSQPPVASDKSSFDWSATMFSGSLKVKTSDAKFPSNRKLFIGVFALERAIFSIVATTSDQGTALRDGVPRSSHIDVRPQEYFVFNVDKPGCNLSVVVTPMSGDPDLFISRDDPHPSSNSSDYFSIKFGGDTIVIPHARVGPFYISVESMVVNGQWWNSSFTVIASLSCGGDQQQNFNYLIDGMPQDGFLTMAQTVFYKFAVSDQHSDVTFSVYRKFGDPDLYIRNDGKFWDGINVTTSQWSSTAKGEDIITIHQNDAGFCVNCEYSITVLGITNTSYTIQARSSTGVSTLVEGQPITEDLRGGESEFFQFTVDKSNAALTISVTDLGRGDPDLFVSKTVTRPTAANHTWAAQTIRGDSITIPFTDPEACALCTYYIGVTAFTNTTFTLVASFSDVVALADGIPQSGTSAKGAFRYYTFQAHGDMTVSLTTISGQQSLYVSTTVLPELNLDTYQWYEPWFSAVKTLPIPSTDEHACKNASCHYSIGVYSGANGTFTITASTSEATKPLQNGIPTKDDVTANQWKYYTFKIESSSLDIAVIVTPISGDPDLYVSLGKQPNMSSYDRSSIRTGDDIVDYDNAALGVYHIGVTTDQSNASYSITVMTTDHNSTSRTSDIITLLPGFPQAGITYHNRFRYYKFLLESTVGELTFSCTKTFGDPDLYVNANNTLPSRESHDYSSLALSADIITIKNAKPGTYIVGVYGFTTSGFSLTASTDDGHANNLQDSVPLRGMLAARTWRYYLVDLDSSAKDLTVSVTPFDGDPDLYISTDTYPNTTTAMWKAIAYRGDSITISKSDPKFCVCEYYIGVFSYAPTTYTIVAEFGGQTRLSEGSPQTGQVAAGQITYYQARLMRNVAVTFTATPINGDIELIVGTNQKPLSTNATWRDASPHSGAKVRIETSDVQYCWDTNCSYFVGVSGKENSNFTMLMTTTGSHVELQDGIPVQTFLAKNEYGHFLFGCEQSGVEVTFVLTTISGDADLYVHDSHYPNKTDSKFSSTVPGSDVIAIPNQNATTYFISIYAFSNSTFTITAYVQSANSSQTTMLVGGVPQNGVVVSHKYKYYHFHLSGIHQNLEISVSRFVGDPDLYVTNNGTDPTISNWQWKSAVFGKDIIDIPNPAPGDYKIGVFAFTTCSFSIVASTTDTVEVLSDGVSFMKDLSAHEWEYFRLPVDATDKDLTVTVTPYGNGDPDLYISDVYPHPNISNARWRSTNFREDSITIPSGLLKAQTYYVGVNAYLNVTFSIVASLSATVRLQDGSSQAGEVSNGAIKFYTMDVQAATALTFTLTPFVGRAFLYVSTGQKPDPHNHTSYKWSSFEDGMQSVTVKPATEGFCSNCAYFVAVMGVVNVTRFSILASSSVAVISLQDGVGVTGSVDEKQWLYYSFVLDNHNADLTVTVTPLSGDPDLYMSLDQQRPTTNNYTLKSSSFGADIIHIDPSSSNYRLGLYYFGVTGYRNASFSIMAKVTDLNTTVRSEKNQQVLLRESMPQVGFLPVENSYALFTFTPSDPKRTVTFTVTPRYGDPDLFVTDRGNISDPQWSSKKWGQDSITISDGCKQQLSSNSSICTYTIKVKAISSTLFSIVASTGVTRLQQGVPLMANLEANSYQYYLFHVDRNDGDLVVSLTAMTGDPDLYLAYNYSKPNKTHYEWKSLAFGSDVIVVSQPSLGDYQIGVYAQFPATFTITATVGALELIPGQPHRDQVPLHKTRQYVVQVQSTPADLEISLDISSGEAVILVNNNPTDGTVVWPSLTNRTWSSDNRTDSTRRGAVTILSTDRRACFNCTYSIGVYGVREASFAIVVRYGAIGTLLESGHPVTSTVEQGSSAYFRAFVNTKENDIQITSTTFVGDASVYVSMTDSQPSASSFTWKSDSMKDSNHISILKTDKDFVPGTFFIGVYGAKRTTFSLSLTTHNVMLRDGVPQSGQCKIGGAFFFLNVDTAEGDITFTLAGVDVHGSGGFGLYVHTETQYDEPSSAHYLWKQDPILEGQSLVISAKDPRHCQHCTYFIGVHGTASQEQETVRFMLRASTESAYEILLDNKMVAGTLDAKEWRYYEMYVSSARALSLVLETCTGNADMYVAQDNYAPNQDQYRWRSVASDQIDSLVIKDGVISGASFFVGVYGSINNTQYRLRVSTTSAQEELIPGDDGRISVATPKTGTVQLTFTPATSPSSEAKKKYSVMYSEKGSDVVMYSACGLKRATVSESIQTDSLEQIVRVVENLKADVGYRFNILVEDADGRQAVYDFVGPVFAPSYLELEGVSVGTILGFAIPAAVLVCAMLGILFFKNRKMTQELSVEMQGVPGAILRKAMRGPRGARDDGKPRGAEKKKYSSLLTTDEGLDDDDEEEIGFYQT